MSVLYMLVFVTIVDQGSTIFRFPEPKFGTMSLEECIAKRRSVRSFKDKPLDLQQISAIMWAGQGITDDETGFRASPSAGATYPLQLYYATGDGVFRYIPESHGAEKILNEDIRNDIAKAALNQMFIADAGMVIIIAAVFENTTQRYGERGVRYVYNEIGHCAQNIHLEAVALKLGSVPIGAFHDEQVKSILGLEQAEPLYIIPVGYPK
jgi:SagB-type dehydrogenase family enzyme